MEILIFNKNVTEQTLTYPDRPTINIIRVRYSDDKTDWVRALSGAMLWVKISAIAGGKEISTVEEPLTVGGLITPYHKAPIIEINRFFKHTGPKYWTNRVDEWIIKIQIKNIDFDQNETLQLEFMDTSYIKKRVTDWQQRVHGLIETIGKWAKDREDVSIQESRKEKMMESMMQSFGVSAIELETANILQKGRVVLVLKPFGLWVMGANGRIDLLTPKKPYILVDKAEAFQEPIWKLYLKDDGDRIVDFDEIAFYQLLDK